MNSEVEPRDAREGMVGFALSNPYFIIVGCLVVTIMGILALAQLPKDLLPSANQPAVQIMSFYSGMPVEHVAADLSTRFELYTGQAIGIERQESKSLTGVSVVKNFFDSDTDLNTAISQTTSLVMSVLRKLPPGTQPPLILPFDPMATTPLALVAVSGDFPEKTLYDYGTYHVRTAIQGVPGAMAPTVIGGAERQIVVYLNPQKLKDYNLSALDVMDRITKLNTFIPTGDIKIGDLDYPILSNGLADKISDMNDFPLRSNLGTSVYLSEVGEAKDASKIQTNVVMIDGKRQVYVPIFRQPGSNSIAVVDQAKVVIEKLKKERKDIDLTLVADQSSFIRRAIRAIADETMIGGGLAALLVFLFLGNPRAAAGLLITIPLSLLGAFVGLQASHQTLNAMTLGGLALAIGVLVDNSIVVLENISTKIQQGMAVPVAAYEGAKEVAMPILASTLATLIVLFPVVFLTGIVKILFSALTKSVMFAMIGSFFAAMTVMPLFASRFLKSDEKLPRFFQIMENGVQKLMSAYARLLKLALAHGKKVIAALVVILPLLVFLLAPSIGTELFPRADAGNFMFEVRLPTGTRIEKTAETAKVFEAHLREWIPAFDLKMIITNAGLTYGLPAAYTPNTGTQDVYFNIELKEERVHSTQYYAKIIREKFPKLYPNLIYNIELGGLLSSALNGGLPSPIDLQVEGPSLEKSADLASQLLVQIQKVKGVVQARIQQRFDAPQIQVTLNRKKSMEMGINTEEVVKNLVSSVNGSATFNPTIWVDPKSGVDYLLGVQFQANQVSSFEQLKSIPITGRSQDRGVPLSRFADITESKGPSEINHVNLKPVIDLYADSQDRDIGSVSKDIDAIVKKFPWPDGYSAESRGEISEMNKSVRSMGGGFALAALLVYLILVVQFKSFGVPLIIMITVPMGMVGIVLMLSLTQTYFSIQAAIGAIFMIGIAVANGVLLIEFILHQAKTLGLNDEAIIAGSKARLRPILMTSLASVLGLVPMAVGIGHGSEANIPLGRSVIGGQLLSVTLTLFVVPILVKLFLAKKKAPLNPRAVAASVMVGLIACVSFSPSFAHANPQKITVVHDQVQNPLRLEEVIEKAIHNSPELRAETFNQEASEQRVGVSESYYLPNLEFQAIDSFGFPGSSNYLGIGGLVGSPFRSGFGAGLVASTTIYDFGRTSGRVQVAKANLNVQKANTEVEAESVKQEAILHLIECSHLQALKENWLEIARESSLIEKEVNGYVKTGQRSVVDQYLVKSQTEEAKTQALDYDGRAKDEYLALQVLTGDLHGKACPGIDEYSLKLSTSFVSAPVIDQYQAYAAISEAKLETAQAGNYPEIVAMGSVGALERSRLVDKNDYSAALGVRLPLFEGFRVSHEVHAARAERDSARELVSAVEQKITLLNQEFDEQIHSAQTRLDRLQLEIAVAQKGYDLAKQRYLDFEGQVVDLREALRNLSRVSSLLNDAKRDLRKSEAGKLALNGLI
jgi:multidrug efflux pump subunit AcrB/outer membrane protein TolC